MKWAPRSSAPPLPVRRTEALRNGRASIEGAIYFLTLCEAHRRNGLNELPVRDALRLAADELHASADFCLIAATVMPDHLHLLGALGSRLSLPRMVGKFKMRTRDVLGRRGLQWQENFYEHRLRRGDDLEPYALYVFLNPYRAGIVPLDRRWPCWWRWGAFQFRFEAALATDSRVPEEWLGYDTPKGASE